MQEVNRQIICRETKTVAIIKIYFHYETLPTDLKLPTKGRRRIKKMQYLAMKSHSKIQDK